MTKPLTLDNWLLHKNIVCVLRHSPSVLLTGFVEATTVESIILSASTRGFSLESLVSVPQAIGMVRLFTTSILGLQILEKPLKEYLTSGNIDSSLSATLLSRIIIGN